MIQTSGSFDPTLDDYAFSICKDKLAITFEGLSRKEVEDLADLFMCLLYNEDDEYTWHHDFEPNDVF